MFAAQRPSGHLDRPWLQGQIVWFLAQVFPSGHRTGSLGLQEHKARHVPSQHSVSLELLHVPVNASQEVELAIQRPLHICIQNGHEQFATEVAHEPSEHVTAPFFSHVSKHSAEVDAQRSVLHRIGRCGGHVQNVGKRSHVPSQHGKGLASPQDAAWHLDFSATQRPSSHRLGWDGGQEHWDAFLTHAPSQHVVMSHFCVQFDGVATQMPEFGHRTG